MIEAEALAKFTNFEIRKMSSTPTIRTNLTIRKVRRVQEDQSW